MWTPPLTSDVPCSSGKKAYETEREALQARDHREQEQDIALDVYYCVECYRWHLTSKVRNG